MVTHVVSNNVDFTNANSNVAAGDIVEFEAGEYAGVELRPAVSGTSSNRITYRAKAGATVVITGLPNGTALNLRDRDYITVQGLTVDGKYSWPRTGSDPAMQIKYFADLGGTSSYNIVEDCNFFKAEGWTAFRIGDVGEDSGDPKATYNIVRRCIMDEVGVASHPEHGTDHGDTLVIFNGEYNLIEDCVLSRGGHNVYKMAGQHNRMRRCVISNDWGNFGNRCGEVGGRDFESYRNRYNVIEECILRDAEASADQGESR